MLASLYGSGESRSQRSGRSDRSPRFTAASPCAMLGHGVRERLHRGFAAHSRPVAGRVVHVTGEKSLGGGLTGKVVAQGDEDRVGSSTVKGRQDVGDIRRLRGLPTAVAGITLILGCRWVAELRHPQRPPEATPGEELAPDAHLL